MVTGTPQVWRLDAPAASPSQLTGGEAIMDRQLRGGAPAR